MPPASKVSQGISLKKLALDKSESQIGCYSASIHIVVGLILPNSIEPLDSVLILGFQQTCPHRETRKA